MCEEYEWVDLGDIAINSPREIEFDIEAHSDILDQLPVMYSDMKNELGRAIQMLKIAAQYIRTYAPEYEIDYDETTCDGCCVADDCDISAIELEELEWRLYEERTTESVG